jgi:hypothetical protein
METQTYKEKRSSPRFPVNIFGSCAGTNCQNKLSTMTHDISAQGLGVIVDSRIPVGTCMDIILEVPDGGKKVIKKGKVVWLLMVESSKFRLGIKLDEPIKPIPLVLRTIKAIKKY